jgi:hypothetical protein
MELSSTAMLGFKAFMNHSDCEGEYTHAECTGLLEALQAIRPAYRRMKFGDRYDVLFDKFTSVFAAAAAKPDGYVIYT